MSLMVARIRADEGALLKKVRLAALQDAPYAFSARYDEMAVQLNSYWQETAARRATADNEAAFFAREEPQGEVIGMAGGFRAKEQPEFVHLVAVWVAPAYRGKGAGLALVEAVCTWAESLTPPVRAVVTYTTPGNARATRVYEKVGFQVQDDANGGVRPGAHASAEDTLLQRDLGAPENKP